ncbi:MAG: VOC family protein [Acidobacteriota bacterium]|nr:VOC family protein [Acidobacteriota bacterium]
MVAERNLVEQFDQAIDALLSGRPEAARFDPELATVLVIAADLRDLPDPNFKSRLKGELMPTTTEATVATRHTVVPYFVVQGAADLIDFLKASFDATELARFPRPDGTIMHAAVSIGDSIIEMGDSSPQYKSLAFGIHIYVADCDAVYERALSAGGTSLHEPMDQFYGERSAAVRDRFGNHWYIATWLQGGPIRPGFRTITPYFHPEGADGLLEFIKQAFDATEFEEVHRSPEGKIAHATLQIGDSLIELGEAHDQWQSMKMQMHVYVDNCDAAWERAVRAGAQTVQPPGDRPYGERNAWVTDAFGNQWFIATPKE